MILVTIGRLVYEPVEIEALKAEIEESRLDQLDFWDLRRGSRAGL
jgi:hypothetical protein